MGIGNIRYAMPSIQTVDVEQVRRKQEELAAAAAREQEISSQPVPAEDNQQLEDINIRQLKPIDPKEVSLTFNKNEDYEYLGSESDIKNLDVQKAISDMKKDSVLQRYQYFVENAGNLVQDKGEMDGFVFLK